MLDAINPYEIKIESEKDGKSENSAE